MAYKEIPMDPPKSFVKFEQIGDYVEGYWVGAEEGQYGLDVTLHSCNGKQGGQRFKDAPGAHRTFTARGAHRRQIEKCECAPDYKLFSGYKADQDTGKESPMKVHMVKVDADATPPQAQPKPQPKPQQQRRPAPPPPADEFADGSDEADPF